MTNEEAEKLLHEATDSAFIAGVIVAQTNAENNFDALNGLKLKTPDELLAEWCKYGRNGGKMSDWIKTATHSVKPEGD